MLNYEFPPIGGGAANAHLHLLIQYATRPDLTVDVLTSTCKGYLIHEKFADNINIYKIPINKADLHYWKKSEVIEFLIKAKLKYRRMIKQNSYDLIHSFFAFPTAWLCYKTKNIPYIVSLRGSDVPGYNIRLSIDYKILAPLFRKIWNNAADVIANSEGLRKLANDFTPDIDIKIIPNGVDTDKFFPAESQHLSKPIHALAVCRLIERKRIDLLIKAVSIAKSLGHNFQLNIVGQGNLLDKLRSLAKNLDITENVNFLSRVLTGSMPDIYRDNHIFVMTSAHEGMSNAMLEAMASGLPIISTRCEGLDELINNNGIIVEETNAKKVAQAMIEATNNQATFKQMAKASKLQADKFTWNAVADQYIQIYRDVLANKS